MAEAAVKREDTRKEDLHSNARQELADGLRDAFKREEPEPQAPPGKTSYLKPDGTPESEPRAAPKDEDDDEPAPAPKPAASPKPKMEPDTRYPALARRAAKEKARLDEQAKAIADREAKLKDRETAAAELDELRKLAKESPYKLAQRLGVSIEQLAEEVTSAGSPEAAIKELRDEQAKKDEAQRKAQEENAAAFRARSERQFASEFRARGDEFKFGNKLYDDDADLIREAWKAQHAIEKELREEHGTDRPATPYEIMREVNARAKKRAVALGVKEEAAAAPAREEVDEPEQEEEPAPRRARKPREEQTEKGYSRRDTVDALRRGLRSIK